MFKKKGLPRASSRGFTLIELLVVLFIIGILASLVVVNVSRSRMSARDTKRIANLKSIQTALEEYNNKNNVYPGTFSSTNVTGWSACSSGSCRPGSNNGWTGMCSAYNKDSANKFTNSGVTGWIPDLAPNLIPVLPADPKQKDPDNCYIYRSDGTDYKVLAFKTMETLCDTGTGPKGPGNSCNSASIQELADPERSDQLTIAVYSSGAINW